MTNEMTKKEMAELIEKLQAEKVELQKSSGSTMKSRVVELIESGMNTIEDIANTLSITSKNVSSNLTAIRHDLKVDGKTIISQRIDNNTKLAIVTLKDLNW